MNRIESIFAGLRAEGKTALMPFVVGGHPRPGMLGDLLAGLERGGASIVEVGIPFSDPIADGPVISAAMDEALRAGCGPTAVFEEVRAARGRVSLGLVAMVSVSVVHRLGGAKGFCERAAGAGFDGLIVPDAPLEASGDLRAAAAAAGLTLSLLVSPSTPPDRAAAIAQASTGFVYLLARAGITGERSDAPEISGPAGVLRAASDLPIACGFGISRAEHVAAVTGEADAAIVGSAMVRRLGEAASAGRDAPAEGEAMARELAGGLRSGPRTDAKSSGVGGVRDEPARSASIAEDATPPLSSEDGSAGERVSTDG
ncbi:MAG: tryptophan synthase subunit alpha [Phycisphaerales bacterium]|nr:MAG: tryptophan synthase subunit alpha [Phycisphaerales bacterium]